MTNNRAILTLIAAGGGVKASMNPFAIEGA